MRATESRGGGGQQTARNRPASRRLLLTGRPCCSPEQRGRPRPALMGAGAAEHGQSSLQHAAATGAGMPWRWPGSCGAPAHRPCTHLAAAVDASLARVLGRLTGQRGVQDLGGWVGASVGFRWQRACSSRAAASAGSPASAGGRTCTRCTSWPLFRNVLAAQDTVSAAREAGAARAAVGGGGGGGRLSPAHTISSTHGPRPCRWESQDARGRPAAPARANPTSPGLPRTDQGCQSDGDNSPEMAESSTARMTFSAAAPPALVDWPAPMILVVLLA